MTVTKVAAGDGFAAVGRIEASTHDLGNVAIKGDLGQIHCGKGMGTLALKSLSAARLAVLGPAVNPGGSFDSQIGGGLGALKIAGDVDGVFIQAGAIGSITIGGSLLGGASANVGRNIASAIGAVKNAQDVKGGGGLFSGEIESSTTLGPLTIGGSLIGGTNDDTGLIKSTGAMGAVKISGDLDGGTGARSGRIFSGATITSLFIGGSIHGGTKLTGGSVESTDAMGVVKIGGDVKGGTGTLSGSVQAGGTMDNVTIGGSLIGGANPTGGTASDTATIGSAGAMGAVKIGGDVRAGSARHSATIGTGSTLASVTIGGSLVGEPLENSGQITSFAAMGPIKIGRDVQGGSISSAAALTRVLVHGSMVESGIISEGALGPVTIGGDLRGEAVGGFIVSTKTIASVTIGGSLIGGPGNGTGRISSQGAMGPVKIGGDLAGGNGANSFLSGLIKSDSTIASVTIGGSIIGGTASGSGEIFAAGTLGPVKIGGDLRGGSLSDQDLSDSGFIRGERITSVTITGSVIAGRDDSGTKALIHNASIAAAHDIGSIFIGSNVLGSVGLNGDVTKLVFSATGQPAATATSDVAIGKLTVLGSVERAQILAGYDISQMPQNRDAQIGPVKIGRDWVASDLVAGVQDAGAAGFGQGDVTIGLGSSIAKIASIAIGGSIAGVADSAETFAFESHVIGSFKLHGATIAIPAAPAFVKFNTLGDVFLRLV
jgi:hypothetical protein